MTLSQMLVFFTPLWPLFLVLLGLIGPWQKHMGYLALFAVIPALLLSGLAPTELSLPTVLMGSVWHTTATANTFLLFTAILWFFSALYGVGYLKNDPHLKRFWTLWLLTLSGNLGLLVSADIISFYGFFALMTFAGYGLVIHSGNAPALRAGRVYLIMAVMGEMLILTGLFLASAATGHTTVIAQDIAAVIIHSDHLNLIMFCFFFGFGVKAGVPLMHLWLPLAHPVAPTPASAVLSGAMIKAGLFAWLSILPLGYLQSPTWGFIFILFGFLAAFGGGIIGILQREPKAVLAYSSISQMGLMTVTVGCVFFRPDQALMLLPILAFFVLHHALAKGALFLSVGINAHSKSIPVFLFGLGMLIPALALIGIVGSGIQAKLLLKEGLYALTLSGVVLGVTLSAIATTGLMWRFLWLLKQQRELQTQHPSVNIPMQIGWAGLIIFGFLAPQLFIGDLTILPVTENLLDYMGLLWLPLLVGAAGVWLSKHPIRLSIPQGDLIVVIERILSLRQKKIDTLNTPLAEEDRLSNWMNDEKLTRRYAAIELFSRSQIAAFVGTLLLIANLLIWLT